MLFLRYSIKNHGHIYLHLAIYYLNFINEQKIDNLKLLMAYS